MVGQTSSHDRILEKLRGDSMGVVYRTEDAKLHQLVALKFVAKPANIPITPSGQAMIPDFGFATLSPVR
jgi:serine/threonine protein kinase